MARKRSQRSGERRKRSQRQMVRLLSLERRRKRRSGNLSLSRESRIFSSCCVFWAEGLCLHHGLIQSGLRNSQITSPASLLSNSIWYPPCIPYRKTLTILICLYYVSDLLRLTTQIQQGSNISKLYQYEGVRRMLYLRLPSLLLQQ